MRRAPGRWPLSAIAAWAWFAGAAAAAAAQEGEATIDVGRGQEAPGQEQEQEQGREQGQGQQPTGAEGEGGEDLDALLQGVDRLLESSRAEARAALQRKDYPAALAAVRRVHELDPDDLPATVQLADLLALLGNLERSEILVREVLSRAPDDAGAHLQLADLLAEGDDDARLAEAAEHLARARELRGNRPELLLRQARLAVRRGRDAAAQAAYDDCRRAAPVDDALRLELGDFHRDFGRPERALSWYRQIEGRGRMAREAAQRIFALEVEREARRYGFTGRGREVPERVHAMIERGQARSAGGEHAGAIELLREAVALAPTHGRARAALADALREAGRREQAELEYLRALSFDPTADTERRLAELYLEEDDDVRAAGAAALLQRALRQRPDRPELHLKLATALRRAGDLPSALLHARRYLTRAEPGAQRQRAEALVAELETLLGDGQTAAPPADVGAGPPGGEALSEARAHLARGETEAALAALAKKPAALRSVEGELLRARILHAAGRDDRAAHVLASLIERRPELAEAHALLGRVRRARGDASGARQALAQAARLGDAASALTLASLDAGDDHGALAFAFDAPRLIPLLHARERLLGVEADGDAELRRQAAALRARVDARLRSVGAAFGLLLLAALSLTLWVRSRIWGGSDLHTLIARAPEAGPELMTILAAIRHEVLKHNTMMLAGFADALRRSAPAGEEGKHIRQALLGPHGAAERLDGYVEQLDRLGRAHGLRLNLRRKDPAISALLEGFAMLDGVSGKLQRVASLGRGGRARLLERVVEAAELLNEQGYQELQALLEEIRSLHVDAGLLQAVHARIAAEPALAGRRELPLRIDPASELPCVAWIPRQAFEEILGNLIRNALQAALREGASPEIGLRVRGEVDPITGLCDVMIDVRDHAGAGLQPSELRGRTIEAGLGLTADRVSRYGGGLDVTPGEGGWAKAVVLRLPGEIDRDD
ncbi:MAG: tetratricopeptide repeat protein [Myxococcales bacterium]|jgi:tetratricopeptide (TPR) repeat protein/signal transduction histidine kinase